MYKFSERSQKRLDTAHNDLQTLANEVLKYRDCSVLCGHRTEAVQNDLFTQVPPKTKVQFPDSKHNAVPSNAIDMAPYIPGVNTYNRKQCLVFGGFVIGLAEMMYESGKMTRKVRWGGDWDQDHNVTDETFEDLVHFELV